MENEELRIAKTESLFRDVNERIAESAQRFESDDAEFVCECAEVACTDRVAASLDEYDGVRAEATHFLLAPGHEDERVERVIERGRRHQIVEKFNRTVVTYVRRFDPRAEPV